MVGSAELAPLRAELMAASVVAGHNHVLRRWLRRESTDPVSELNGAMGQVISLFASDISPAAMYGGGTVVVAFRSSQNIEELIPALRQIAHSQPDLPHGTRGPMGEIGL
jgi:hypothetical protein